MLFFRFCKKISFFLLLILVSSSSSFFTIFLLSLMLYGRERLLLLLEHLVSLYFFTLYFVFLLVIKSESIVFMWQYRNIWKLDYLVKKNSHGIHSTGLHRISGSRTILFRPILTYPAEPLSYCCLWSSSTWCWSSLFSHVILRSKGLTIISTLILPGLNTALILTGV